jgi:hypothetical protein
MFRTARAIILAVVVAVSLVGSTQVANAGSGPVKSTAPVKAPAPINSLFDITWE